jgi:DNA-binding IclR family transcriptional regulator
MNERKGSSRLVSERAAPALLERQLAVVDRVAETPAGLSFTAIQKSLGLSKATTHRIIQSLCAVGLLDEGDGGARLYRLGGRLIRLLGLAVSPDRLIPLSRPILVSVVEEFGETTFLAMLRGREVETIAMVTPIKDWQGHVHPGRVMPAHAAASAKAIVAFQEEATWDTHLQLPLQAFTARTLVDPAAVRREYWEIRKRGFARCVEEIDLGQIAIAAPVRLGDVGTVFSVCVVGPTNRILEHSIERIAASLISAASRLSALAVSRIENAGS